MDSIATLRLRKPLIDNILGLYFENYDLIFCEYSFFKDINRNGEVISNIIGGNINVTLPILPTDDLMSWVFGYQKYINGEISLNDARKEVIDKFYFEEARCTEFKLHYEAGVKVNTIINITINAQKIIMGEAIYENYWKS